MIGSRLQLTYSCKRGACEPQVEVFVAPSATVIGKQPGQAGDDVAPPATGGSFRGGVAAAPSGADLSVTVIFAWK